MEGIVRVTRFLTVPHQTARGLLLLLLFFGFLASGFGFSPGGKEKQVIFGGTYDKLQSYQKALVDKWFTEYSKITGEKIPPADGYNSLRLSFRTTFEAVTHALAHSKLTDENGQSLGTALDLVEMVEAVHGRIPHTSGDNQFRVYVLLKKDAVDRLYASREFRRRGDNTVFHIGYPLNFRQEGGAPSIQFSVARTGRRADIDVDYRSSKGPTALFSGHLTAANSDVRAGNNYERHVHRWEGFRNWWRNLFGLPIVHTAAPETGKTIVEIPDTPAVYGKKPVFAAVADFFRTWLVERKPEIAMAYIAPESYSCIAEFYQNRPMDDALAQIQILQHMKDINDTLNQPKSLKEVLEPVTIRVPHTKPVRQHFNKQFTLVQIREDMAWSMDCRQRLHLQLAQPKPMPKPEYRDSYLVMTRLKVKGGKAAILTQLWTWKDMCWKQITWTLGHPIGAPEVPRVADKAHTPKHVASLSASDAGVIARSQAFLKTWLVEKNYQQALDYFAPEAHGCAKGKGRNWIREQLAFIGDKAGTARKLNSLIHTVSHGHSHLYEVPHPAAKSYLLGRISDDLASMFTCKALTSEQGLDRNLGTGEARFAGKHYVTAFRLKHASGVPAVFAMIWAERDGQWSVISYKIITD